MIWSEIRAQGWKYGCYAVLALLIAACALAVWQRGSVAKAELTASNATKRADKAEAELTAAKEAAKRDAQSAVATDTARSTNSTQAAEIQDRHEQLEQRATARPAVPMVCPLPDAVVSAELQNGADRIRAATGRLRAL